MKIGKLEVLLLFVAVIIGLFLTKNLVDPYLQAQTAPPVVAPAPTPCFDIIDNRYAIHLLDRCTGENWKYHNGYNNVTKTQEFPPSWIPIPKQ